jgi:hypothetical protein
MPPIALRSSPRWSAAKGDKALVGNTGYRRYLKTISQDHFAIDPDKVEEEKRFDGIFVLCTNTDLNPLMKPCAEHFSRGLRYPPEIFN